MKALHTFRIVSRLGRMLGLCIASTLTTLALVFAANRCTLEQDPQRGDRARRDSAARPEKAGGEARADERDQGRRHDRDRPANRRNAGASRSDTPPQTYLVTRVVDGDTLELGNGETVRIVGIDTPERGDCGYDQATQNLADLVQGEQVTLTVSDEDRDAYDRLLRYVDLGALDAGYRQIRDGFAIARYDSRDGYGYRVREPAYIKADRANPNYKCAPEPPRPDTGGGASCAAGYSPCIPPYPPDLDCGALDGPIYVTGSDLHELDADGDGVACE